MEKTHKKAIEPADKIKNIPKYIFAKLEEEKAEARKRGINLIDLGIGNPDGATPKPVVDAAKISIMNSKSHGYPSFKGKIEFRNAISKWLKNRYDIKVDAECEIQTLSGAKEGIAMVSMAFTNPNDINIVPDPYYPVMSRGTWISSGKVFHVPLREENNFLMNFDEIPKDIAQKAKILFLNYPNNPTGAVATREFMEKAVKFCKENGILLVYDLAYAEICFDDYKPLSIFKIEGAKDVAVEFHSFSKTFNMAGWRIGFVVGKKEFIDAIHAMKTNFDYGTSNIVQDAAIQALEMDIKHVKKIAEKYQRRRDLLIPRLEKLGWKPKNIVATMYFWLKIPNGYSSNEWCKMVMEKTGVVFTPGKAFGDYSDKYFRFSTVQPDEKLIEAMDRLEKAGINYS